ncbi:MULTISPECIES: MFS transporter [unclassified Streptomyces]|uniref:MFS transporter n=1 Tax=unclassified Streptomyces TaxID=2593676 RepID=UPI002443198B|nr:MFS transporter [Streptomyces sp. DH41]MDG9722026.1 MFS transporter [Streptomyces sp. DH41]
MTATKGQASLWALIATSLPMFMVSLDNLIVTNALVDIGKDFDVKQSELQWVMNGYVLAFAGLLLAGAALGDRFGRRRVFLSGVVLFTVSSVGCALAGSVETLIAARVLQGAGAAAILPVSLTLAVAAVPRAQRNMAVGVWGGVNGLGIAIGPLAGGLVTEQISWSWIFWINVPVGLLTLPLALWAVRESRGNERSLNVGSMVLVTGAVVTAVWGIVSAADHGWTETSTLVGIALAVVLTVAFVISERVSRSPLIPVHMYRVPAFVLSNVVSITMYFGVFGSIFYLTQFLQGPMGYSPFEAGLRTLPWTVAPMIVVPIASQLVDRIGGGVMQAAGCALQGLGLGWIALIVTPDIGYGAMVPALALAGIGMGLVFAGNPATVISSVRESEHNKASGANNTSREFGGALGVAALTTVFSHQFNADTSGNPMVAFTDGLESALWIGVAVVLLGALSGLFIKRGAVSADDGVAEPAAVPAPVA